MPTTRDPRTITLDRGELEHGGRVLGNAKFEELVALVRAGGLAVPVFVMKGKCVSGHYRLLAALAAGTALVPVVAVESAEDVDRWFEGK